MQPLFQASKAPVDTHFKCMEDPFHPGSNPGGYINFGTAENHLLWDVLQEKIHRAPPMSEPDSHYQMLYGKTQFRQSIARLFSRRAGREVSPRHIVTAAGGLGILEILAFILCDQGDGVLVPAPYYVGFDYAFVRRANARLIPVPTHSSSQFHLDLDTLETSLNNSRRQGINVKALLITSPHNPLGIVYSSTQLQRFADFCRSHDLQLVVDEIYAETYFPGVSFSSILSLDQPHVHTVYGFAKDFGLSGLYTGALHSTNESLLKAAQKLAHFHRVANPIQSLLSFILEDDEWVNALFETNRQRVFDSYRIVTRGLDTAGIPYIEARGGIFVFMDLRKYL
ncbi:MAG: aminotransferase class I/II-fold pyridoxal phosphate-dependent enzyme, partial [bacterium]|nr:aminotransferase class I/II-fold pyridoxal phosphate-dependent enzyme [bacterium]